MQEATRCGPGRTAGARAGPGRAGHAMAQQAESRCPRFQGLGAVTGGTKQEKRQSGGDSEGEMAPFSLISSETGDVFEPWGSTVWGNQLRGIVVFKSRQKNLLSGLGRKKEGERSTGEEKKRAFADSKSDPSCRAGRGVSYVQDRDRDRDREGTLSEAYLLSGAGADRQAASVQAGHVAGASPL